VAAVALAAVLWDYWGNMTKVGTDNNYCFDSADRLTKYDGAGTSDDTTCSYFPGGWRVIRIWECALAKSLRGCLRRIRKGLTQSSGKR